MAELHYFGNASEKWFYSDPKIISSLLSDSSICFVVALLSSSENDYAYRIQANSSTVDLNYLEGKLNTLNYWNMTTVSRFTDCFSWQYHNCNDDQICFHSEESLQSKCVDKLLTPSNLTIVSSILFGKQLEVCDHRFQHHSVVYNSQCIVFIKVHRSEEFTRDLCAKKLNSDWTQLTGNYTELKGWGSKR